MIAEARQLVVAFRRGLFRRKFQALAGLDLEIGEGDFFALLGQNGAGKSTAMHCLLGLLSPTSGDVRLLGQRPDRGSALFREIAYLPEEPRYPDYLTVREAVTYYAALSGVASAPARVADVLEWLGLAEHRHLTIRRCSKGMKQKVGIAQCIVHEPRVLFLDEPMRGLDPMTVHAFRTRLVDMNRRGATVIMNSHLLTEVEIVASRVAIIDRGRLVVQDDVSTLLRGDGDDYAVEVAGDGGLPPQLQLLDPVRADGHARGVVRGDALYAFMDAARSTGLRIVSCELKKIRLEDRFMALLKEGAHEA
jgi:ABC-2 type transport system ATP-binding protein